MLQTAEGSAVTCYVHFLPPLSHIYTGEAGESSMMHSRHILSANSCPVQIGSIICNAGLHKYMHADIQSCSVASDAVIHAHVPTGTHTQMRLVGNKTIMVRWAEGRGRAGDEYHFLFLIQ